jgi:hypothetical protein
MVGEGKGVDENLWQPEALVTITTGPGSGLGG